MASLDTLRERRGAKKCRATTRGRGERRASVGEGEAAGEEGLGGEVVGRAQHAEACGYLQMSCPRARAH